MIAWFCSWQALGMNSLTTYEITVYIKKIIYHFLESSAACKVIHAIKILSFPFPSV